MRFISTLILAAAAILVNAQSETTSGPIPTGTGGIDDSILNCVSQAASSAGCSSFADLPCVCTSQQFQSEALTCLQSNCSPDDLAAAQALQQSQCAAVTAGSSVLSSLSSVATSAISSLSSRISSFTAGTQTGTVTAASGSGTATNTSTNNAALGLKGAFAPGAALSAAVGVVGLAVGALII